MATTKNVFQEALEKFFDEDYELADDAGYELTVTGDEDGSKILVEVDSTDPMLPAIDVYPRKQPDDSWEFMVDVTFPPLNLDNTDSLVEIVESWKPAAILADDIASVKFVFSEWT